MGESSNSSSSRSKTETPVQGFGSGSDFLNAGGSIDSTMEKQDEVMKRRLLIDGDGAGDDRRILGITKSFLSWCFSSDNEDERNTAHKRLLTQLAHIEYGHVKTHFSIETYAQLKQYYDEVQEEIKSQIEKTKLEVAEYKDLLEKANDNRRKKTEYDTLSRIIKTAPERKKLEEDKSKLEEDLEILMNEKKRLDEVLENRKRNMKVLMESINRMNDLLEEDAVKYGLQAVDNSQAAGDSSSLHDTSLEPIISPESPVEQNISLDDITSSSSDEKNKDAGVHALALAPRLPSPSPGPSRREHVNVEEHFQPLTQNYNNMEPYASVQETRSIETYDDLSE